MKYYPHDYQKYATEFIEKNPISAVLLDMGLGKTVIALTAIYNLIFDWFEVGKVLIIAPLRVARDTWSAEIEKWEHLNGLIYSVVIGTEKERLSALQKKAHVYLINRENVEWLIMKSGYAFDFDMLVIDELSSFKSGQTKRFKSLMKARPKVKRVVGLTGTPSSNGLMDLWAEFRLLDLGHRLGRYITRYRETYFLPDKRNGVIVYSYKPREGAEEEIYQRISDITISMKATDYLDMPECINNVVEVRMDEKETEKYKALKKDMVLKLGSSEIDALNAASLSNKLLQMANGAIYDREKAVIPIHDHKLDAMTDLIEAANGKPVLVAYWYTHDFLRISERLHKLHIPFTEMKTSDDIRKWNSGETPVALIHPASAGHGLNLQAGGSTLVWFGLTWSLELYQQTNARLWRQGQKSRTVVIHHIVTKGTIDERVMKALESKDKIQNELMNAVKAELEVAK